MLRKTLLSLFLILIFFSPSIGRNKNFSPVDNAVTSKEPVGSPKVLPQALADGTVVLREKILTLESRDVQSKEELSAAEIALRALRIRVASLRATMILQKLSLPQMQEIISSWNQKYSETKCQLKDVNKEIGYLRHMQGTETAALALLKTQINILKSTGQPLPPGFQKIYDQYWQMASSLGQVINQLVFHLELRGHILQLQKALMADLQPQMEKIEEDWEATLLKRPVQKISLKKQATEFLETLAALPDRTWNWLTTSYTSGNIISFFWERSVHLLGLLSLIIVLGQCSRWLQRRVGQRLKERRDQTENLPLFALLSLGYQLIANLFLLSIIVVLGISGWVLGMLNSKAAWIVLYILAGLCLWRLISPLSQDFFPKQKAKRLLELEDAAARFYRRSFKLLGAYLILGNLGLKSAELLGFPASNLQLMEHFYQVGILFWILWLMRRHYLNQLQPQLPDPTWLRQPGVAKFFQGLIAVLLSVIILSKLLGFHNLSFYLAQGAMKTCFVLISLWFLWLTAGIILQHFLIPEHGLAWQRFPERRDLLQKIYNLGFMIVSFLLGGIAIIVSLYFWGIKPESMVTAFSWLTWGPTIGPLKLTPLNLGSAALVWYLGCWLSRGVRTLVIFQVFPRMTLDDGVQYTIARSLHYVILVLTGLLALNLLGFPLTNLALAAGALGIGIGFGLQNIVNNFLSGLILLFERPIKVGDMLVIDDQWGLVKEIRVRSTVFQTFDRSIMIIPNSELISNKVLNWTHDGNGVNRLTLKVGVSYCSDGMCQEF